jgi:hypothetical protein
MTTSRPPGRSTRSAASSATGRTVSSRFTAIRSAWNTRVAGWMRRRAAGGPARLGLLPVLAEDARELRFVEPGDERGRGLAGLRIEAHVQRPGRAEAETPFRRGELIGAEPEIEEHAIAGCEPLVAGHLLESLEVRLAQRHPVVEPGQSGVPARDRGGVRVDAQEPAVGRGGLQDPDRVPTAAEGRVHVEASRHGREGLEDLADHDGKVPFLQRLDHRSTGAVRIPEMRWDRQMPRP